MTKGLKLRAVVASVVVGGRRCCCRPDDDDGIAAAYRVSPPVDDRGERFGRCEEGVQR